MKIQEEVEEEELNWKNYTQFWGKVKDCENIKKKELKEKEKYRKKNKFEVISKKNG